MMRCVKYKSQHDELTRKLNEKISTDLSKFQKTIDDIFKQKQIRQHEYFIQKIEENRNRQLKYKIRRLNECYGT